MAEVKVCVNFFDDSNQSPIYVAQDTELQVRHSGGGKWITVKLGAKSEKGFQHFEVPKEIVEARKGTEPLFAELRLSAGPEVGCTRYATSTVTFLVKEESDADCCCIPCPLHRLAEACSIKFRAFDASEEDFIKNAKVFQSSVDWVVTAVRAPVITHESTAKSHAATLPSAPRFQPFTSSARSVDGIAEIFDVPLHGLYQIEARAPEGYISEGGALQYRYICCERSVDIKHYFRPCGKRPTRSAVFVQQKCQGIRWGKGTTVLVGNREVTIGEDGIMKIPNDLNGVLPVSSAGKAFTPSSLDLREGAPPVTTVAVSDQPVTASGRNAEGLLLDHTNKPFVGRRVAVLLPNGDEIEVLTDQQGRFQAPVGSTVYAREDEWGLATERVYLTEKI